MTTNTQTQTPDARPGKYFVTAIDNGRFARLVGPFATHADALALVDRAREVCYGLTGGASHWWAFGTCRQDDDALSCAPGKINSQMAIVDAA